MANTNGSKTWQLAALVALVAVAAVLLLMVARKRARQREGQPQAHRTMPGADAGTRLIAETHCNLPPLAFPTLNSHGAPPVLLSGPGKARFFIDGTQVFSATDAPKTFPLGEHSLKVELDGQDSIDTRFRLDAFTPALFHVTVEPEAGLSLLRLGVVCKSCAPAFAEVDFSFPRGVAGDTQLRLREAARAMREDDWQLASTILRNVPPKDRRNGTFIRLSSSVYSAAIAPDRAREILRQLAGADQKALRPVLADYEKAADSEAARRQKLLINKWNKLTDRFAAFGQNYEPAIRSQMGAAALRMEQLSPHFEQAVNAKDEAEQETTIKAVEDLMVRLAKDLLATRPTDCAFQQEIAAALLK